MKLKGKSVYYNFIIKSIFMNVGPYRQGEIILGAVPGLFFLYLVSLVVTRLYPGQCVLTECTVYMCG